MNHDLRMHFPLTFGAAPKAAVAPDIQAVLASTRHAPLLRSSPPAGCAR